MHKVLSLHEMRFVDLTQDTNTLLQLYIESVDVENSICNKRAVLRWGGTGGNCPKLGLAPPNVK